VRDVLRGEVEVGLALRAVRGRVDPRLLGQPGLSRRSQRAVVADLVAQRLELLRVRLGVGDHRLRALVEVAHRRELGLGDVDRADLDRLARPAELRVLARLVARDGGPRDRAVADAALE
jgi:hypothetical protein